MLRVTTSLPPGLQWRCDTHPAFDGGGIPRAILSGIASRSPVEGIVLTGRRVNLARGSSVFATPPRWCRCGYRNSRPETLTTSKGCTSASFARNDSGLGTVAEGNCADLPRRLDEHAGMRFAAVASASHGVSHLQSGLPPHCPPNPDSGQAALPIDPPSMLVYKVSRRVPRAILCHHVPLCTSLCGRHLPFPCVVSHIPRASSASGLAQQHGSLGVSPAPPFQVLSPFLFGRHNVSSTLSRYGNPYVQLVPDTPSRRCLLLHAGVMRSPICSGTQSLILYKPQPCSPRSLH